MPSPSASRAMTPQPKQEASPPSLPPPRTAAFVEARNNPPRIPAARVEETQALPPPAAPRTALEIYMSGDYPKPPPSAAPVAPPPPAASSGGAISWNSADSMTPPPGTTAPFLQPQPQPPVAPRPRQAPAPPLFERQNVQERDQ